MSFKVWEQDIYFDYQLLLSMQLICEMQKIDIFLVRLVADIVNFADILFIEFQFL